MTLVSDARRLSTLVAVGSMSGMLAGCSPSLKSGADETRSKTDPIAVDLNPVPGHAALTIGSWAPWSTEISKAIPPSLHKVPDHSDEAVFGEFSFGEGTRYRVQGTNVGFMLDEKRERFIADENRNGDLTDDLPASWTVERRPSRDGKDTWGQVTVRTDIATANRYDAPAFTVALFFNDTETRAKFNESLSLDRYRDYATEGYVQLGEKRYRVLLDDGVVSGDFSATPEVPRLDITLRIDVNGNGLYENAGEAFDAHEPFTIGGVTYEVQRISKDGTHLELRLSDRSAPEIAPPPDLRVGRQIPGFSATTITGERIEFPGSFKGKIILLDFWASWCGPCVREIPHLKEAFAQFHDQGLEIVSVSIDEEKTRREAEKIIATQQLNWNQVFDTGGWKGNLISRFSPGGIPAGYLVDDSGRILASLQQLRGEQLHSKIHQVFEARRAK